MTHPWIRYTLVILLDPGILERSILNLIFFLSAKTCETEDEIDAFVQGYAKTDYHLCGTNKMGAEDDPMAVVDAQTRVFGVDNLRVVDASVFPSIVSGNLNASTLMMAEKAADSILGKSPLPKEHVPVYGTSWPLAVVTELWVEIDDL